MPAGHYSGPPSPLQTPSSAPRPLLPAYCDVRGVTIPSSDSEIELAVWLPAIRYYESVRKLLTEYPDARGGRSGPIEDSYRLFMVPGMAHCGDGIGGPLQGDG